MCVMVNARTWNYTNSLTPDLGVCGFFLKVKFATSLLASHAGGFNEDYMDKFFDTIYRWQVDFFSQLNLLPPYLLRSQGDNNKNNIFGRRFTYEKNTYMLTL